METSSEVAVKRGRGRPRKDETPQAGDNQQKSVVASRDRIRTPVSGSRNLLTVNLRPDIEGKYKPRWVKDESANGARIQKFLQAGYEFVTKDEVLGVGEGNIHFNASLGSVIRVPAGKEYSPKGEPIYLYLMKQPIEFYEEDMRMKNRSIDEKEAAALNQFKEREGDGAYGSIKIQR